MPPKLILRHSVIYRPYWAIPVDEKNGNCRSERCSGRMMLFEKQISCIAQFIEVATFPFQNGCDQTQYFEVISINSQKQGVIFTLRFPTKK